VIPSQSETVPLGQKEDTRKDFPSRAKIFHHVYRKINISWSRGAHFEEEPIIGWLGWTL
jgi:hypothetical protein